jgi:hypothetical protein
MVKNLFLFLGVPSGSGCPLYLFIAPKSAQPLRGNKKDAASIPNAASVSKRKFRFQNLNSANKFDFFNPFLFGHYKYNLSQRQNVSQ